MCHNIVFFFWRLRHQNNILYLKEYVHLYVLTTTTFFTIPLFSNQSTVCFTKLNANVTRNHEQLTWNNSVKSYFSNEHFYFLTLQTSFLLLLFVLSLPLLGRLVRWEFLIFALLWDLRAHVLFIINTTTIVCLFR